jgi:hypothetical protein
MPESWPPGNGTESPEDPLSSTQPWGSVNDTGSMEPIPDAVVWAERADAWSQRPTPAPEAPGTWEEPASRWSEVAATGRPAFPPEGVGWRSETAEWRSSTETARWRTTTEWRSSEGTSGWRSTTEAWQTGGNRDGQRPVETPTRQPAISGTAWPTPGSAQGSPPDEQPWSTPAAPWQNEPATPTWQSEAAAPPWQATSTPTWQAPVERTPPWQTAAPTPPMPPAATPPWQAAAPTPSWQQEAPQPWQQEAWQHEAQQREAQQREAQQREAQQREAQQRQAQQQESRPPWQTPAEPTRSWQQPAPPTPPWQQPAEPVPTWQQPAEPVPTWQQPAEQRTWDQDQRTRQQPGDQPTWQQRQQAPAWQEPVEPPPAPSWRSDPETRQVDARPAWQASAAAPAPERPWDAAERGWTPTAAPPANPNTGAWSGAAYDDGRHLVREDDRAAWRRDEGTRRVGRRRAAEPEDAQSAGTGWAVQSDADNWAGHTDTGAMPLYQDPAAREDGWRRDEPESRRARRSREEPDSGSWSRDDEPRTDTGSWRGRAAQDAPAWRGADSAEDTAVWRRSREMEAASDPWERGAADTGVGDMGWQSASETGSRRGAPRSDPGDDGRQAAGPRGMAPEERRPPADDDRTEVRRQPAEPGTWQREQAMRGSASYREGHTEDWRRDLAAESGGVSDGEPKRFGTSDFPPFRPPGAAGGSAPPPVSRPSGVARSAPVADPREDGRPREELLVGARSGGGGTGSWQGPPDTQWPPRGATGYQRSAGGGAGPYERRPVSTLPDPSGRRNLLDEPEDDFEEVTGGPLAAVGYTALWYGVPVVLFVLYMLVLDSKQQAHALSTLAGAAPQFGLSLALSMAVAVGLRWASGSWKAASVGLAAAVMGGGLATVLTSAITGNSLS